MSTSVGHFLFGLSAASLCPAQAVKKLYFIIFVLVMANLPDIDLFFGFFTGNPNQYHHQWTHSLAFAFFAGIVVFFLAFKKTLKERFLWAMTAVIVVSSHILLDMFSLDLSEPYGLQLFWPASHEYYIGPVAIFRDVHKSSANGTFIQSLFCLHNLYTIGLEIAILLPFYYLVFLFPNRLRGALRGDRVHGHKLTDSGESL